LTVAVGAGGVQVRKDGRPGLFGFFFLFIINRLLSKGKEIQGQLEFEDAWSL
jgi:hypothetical protein